MPGVSEKELLKLQDEGWDSDLIRLRLAYAGNESILKYLMPIRDQDRVHPHFLVTQRSGRWSITNPPLPNWSIQCISPACVGEWHVAKSTKTCWSLRDIVAPDPGTYFLKRDWDAVEAKLAAAYSGDEEDLQCFADGLDIHVKTGCMMFGFPVCPDLVAPHRKVAIRRYSEDQKFSWVDWMRQPSPLDEALFAWQEATSYEGKDTWWRVAAKTCRYALTYAEDERSIHLARDVEKLAPTKQEREVFARRYLESKPKLSLLKGRVWKQVIETNETRTALGRRRRFFVSSEEREKWLKWERPGHACKQGFNHLFQGQVADMQNLTLIAIKQRWPEARLGYQTHDGDLWVFPETTKPYPAIKEIVERDWDVNGAKVASTASWSVIYADGTKEDLS